ncbi:H/ACA ribonucleoprotein complex subunit Nhp2 [Neofusicoccum parvum]|uniref:H/ACA ribonucleoprotein complex subunit 2 n=2 Tax=Neofusicoccum parvum TaxID=310453 RepID=R1E996_BOTPV|nr:putative h aca ribonucleoprotein complex subunit 2 protein [Neofusicoccum parvum UCRNP2]GME28732.1 H/ACA ribonucleoprotein complex subunit Nhp2 [Neofusicoccum parvum]GME44104.1 H/ACA ribonucleoprotein complex subunit Nhp2 [Neofusicoccum parvum]
MAKDKVKEKKEKKEKRSETDGVKKSKKDKKEKKQSEHVTEALLSSISDASSGADVRTVVVSKTAGESDDEAAAGLPVSALNLVPFAVPLADDKVTKKIFKTVKKAAKHKTLKRGVKEVVKAVRKSSTNLPASSLIDDPSAVVVIAADISPMDVISHIPVLCEEHNIPYIFVTSRAELGAAGNTKRPTSVVMICKDRGSKKASDDAKAEDEADYKEAYDGVVKAVLKASKGVRR